MKIYTKTGDKGMTALLGGDRVDKHHPLVTAYGTVDELNSIIGMAQSSGAYSSIPAKLSRIQNELFDVGADLSLPTAKQNKNVTRITSDYTNKLETEIDEIENQLEPLTQFILPGGTHVASLLHFARTVCRRAERACMIANEGSPINPEIIKYLNRLSDWLFCMARFANHIANVKDIPWEKNQS